MATSTVTNVKLTSCKLVQEDGEEYLYLIYTFEDNAGTHELYIPRVELRINHDTLPELGYRHGVGRVTLLGREFTLKECKSIYLPTLLIFLNKNRHNYLFL